MNSHGLKLVLPRRWFTLSKRRPEVGTTATSYRVSLSVRRTARMLVGRIMCPSRDLI